MLQEALKILAQSGDIQGQIRLQRCDGKCDHAAKSGTEFVGLHLLTHANGTEAKTTAQESLKSSGRRRDEFLFVAHGSSG